jgi:hypothetical protein
MLDEKIKKLSQASCTSRAVERSRASVQLKKRWKIPYGVTYFIFKSVQNAKNNCIYLKFS